MMADKGNNDVPLLDVGGVAAQPRWRDVSVDLLHFMEMKTVRIWEKQCAGADNRSACGEPSCLYVRACGDV